MRSSFSYIFTLSQLFFCVAVSAQKMVWTGTKTPYTPQQNKFAATPKGYTPLFVNHVGRHGSRFMTKSGSDSILFHLFNLIGKDGLTDEGKIWQKNNADLTKIQTDQYGNITGLGALEQNAIASRILKSYPSLFLHAPKIDVWYTHKIRTYQSAQSFLSAFKSTQQLDINYIVQPDTAETILRFYDYAPALEALKKSKNITMKEDSLYDLPEMKNAYKAISSRFIKKEAWDKFKSENKTLKEKNKQLKISHKLFASSLFDVYGVGLSAQEELGKKWSCPFSQEEGFLLGRAEGGEDYLTKGPGINKNGVQVRIAAPLLLHFLTSSDSVINGQKKVAGIFRFTHAEAIAPLAALMEIRGADSSTNSIFSYTSAWDPGKVIPMAANIQWIFYTNKKTILVKILLNEKESTIPVKTDKFPYYDWTSVKKYYYNKLSKMGLSTTTNPMTFLQNLK